MPSNLPMAGYLTLINKGSVAQVLIAASSPEFGETGMHQTVRHEGLMSMRVVRSIEIKPQTSVQFARAGYHLMLMRPRHALKIGDHVQITLQFSNGASLLTDFVVREDVQ